MDKEVFLAKAYQAAVASGHVFPAMAACEAALESAWGKSVLAVEDNNLFGMKQHRHPVYGTVNLPTKEFLHGAWVKTTAAWVKYPSWVECFADRVDTLHQLSGIYPEYAQALTAVDESAFVKWVSKRWSTDPYRAEKVLQIRLDQSPFIATLMVGQADSVKA